MVSGGQYYLLKEEAVGPYGYNVYNDHNISKPTTAVLIKMFCLCTMVVAPCEHSLINGILTVVLFYARWAALRSCVPRPPQLGIRNDIHSGSLPLNMAVDSRMRPYNDSNVDNDHNISRRCLPRSSAHKNHVSSLYNGCCTVRAFLF